jgi:rSAM/selenodomain-associated transferase 2
VDHPSVSVVIPARDEADLVAYAIRSVRAEAHEVIVVDGASRDGTADAARAEGAHVIGCAPSRGLQLDAGARAATGEWLVFLHADTRLESGWCDALRAVPDDAAGGAFRFAIDSAGPSYRAIEAAVALRCRALGLPYGDQALFARRSAYAAAGGFPPIPLMEDVAFVKRLRRLGPLALLRPRALTHARRWERHGVLGASARNLWLLALYAAGTPPERLARDYGARP